MSSGRAATSFTTSRPVAVLMVFTAALVFGFFSYDRLPLTLMPELTYPTLTVRTEYPGAAPEEVENDVSRPIEESLGVIGGLSRISSISRAGVSDVVLEFQWDTDMSAAAQDALEKLDLVFLPEEAERPRILHYDPSLDPILELSLSGSGAASSGEAGLRRLRRIAELQVKRALEPVKGVAAVRVRGGLEEEIHVLLDEDALRRTGVSIQRVIDRLREENVNVAGGEITEGRTEYMVRTLNEYEDLDQIEETVIASFAERDLRVRDLGRVERAHKEREIRTRTDGGESVQIDVYKEADANIVAVARRVEELLGASPAADGAAPAAEPAEPARREGAARGLAAALLRDEGVRLSVVADRSRFIESSIREVRNTAILGGLLATVVLFLFLRNVRTTLIIAVSIPMSLLIAFAPLNLLGVSLNVMSLGGLALGIGMLVDSSIVVLESIFRCREEGDDIVRSAVRGTAEVRGAVFASILTTIAVFLPMVFVEGIAGQAFGDLGLAVVVSLLASLAVALAFIPMLASRPPLRLGALERGRSGPLPAALQRPVAAWRRAGWALRVAGAPVFLLWIALAALAALVRRGAGRVARAWRASPVWARVVLAPLVLAWLVASPLLELVARLAPGALASFRDALSGVPRWRAVVAAPYLALRLVIATALEILARTLLGVAAAVLAAGAGLVRLLRPAVGALLALPLRGTAALLEWLQRTYAPLLRQSLRHPGLVAALVLACLAVAAWSVTGLDSELLPEVRQGEFTFEIALPVGTPLERTEEVLAPVEQALLDERAGIDALLVTFGYDAANTQRSDEGEHTARFKVLLEPDGRGRAPEDALVERIRARFAAVPDVEARLVRPVLFSSKTPIEVEVHGDDLARLRDQADAVAEVMARLPQLADVETTLRSGAPEVQIVYDRDQLARQDLDIGTVARLVRDKVKGSEATRFNLQDRRIPIVVRLEQGDRETVADVRELTINPAGSRALPLSAVADVVLGEGPSEVRRVDGRRVALVRANIAAGSLGSASAAITEALRSEIDWPADMTFLLAGQNEEWERSRSSLVLALGLSVFLVYVIMAAQFESLTHPFVILFTIPLALFGSVLALRVLSISLSIVVFLGAILLAGIVVNNAIVLVDYVNTLRRRGLARHEAVVQAGAVRLRPILMTTATTVLGLTPMALGLGDGAEIRTPMAITVIAGLITSTALTLIVIPVTYVLVDRLQESLFGPRPETVRGHGDELGAAGGAEAVPS